jgi:hypothetical protein
MMATFTAVEDSTEYFGDFKKREKRNIEVYVIYELRDGLVSSINVARVRDLVKVLFRHVILY